MREARWLSEDRPVPHKKNTAGLAVAEDPRRRGSAASRWRGDVADARPDDGGSAGRCREGGVAAEGTACGHRSPPPDRKRPERPTPRPMAAWLKRREGRREGACFLRDRT